MNYIRSLSRQTHKAECFPPLSSRGQACILTGFPPVCFPPASDKAHAVQLEQPNLYTEVKHLARCLTRTAAPVFQEVICLWKNRAYRLEAFLLYRSPKRSNLNFKCNFNHHRSWLKLGTPGPVRSPQISPFQKWWNRTLQCCWGFCCCCCCFNAQSRGRKLMRINVLGKSSRTWYIT